MVRSKLKGDQNINLHATYYKNKRNRIMGIFICDIEQKIFTKIY